MRFPLYVGGSEEDPYEHRQIPAARERVPDADVLTFPGGHLTTSEHPDLLAAAIRDIAARHGVGAVAVPPADELTSPDETEGTHMTKMAPLLERNEQFARGYQAIALAPPAAQVLIVTCLDHRVDPAITLGLRLGDAPVIRNAGGRVTPAVIDDIAYLAFLAGELFGGQSARDTLFEVAIVHHTQCGTGLLADAGFRRQAAEATGLAEAELEAAAVADPHETVKADVERLLTSPLLSPKVSVSGHVYDVATGRVATVIDAGTVSGASMRWPGPGGRGCSPGARSGVGAPAGAGDARSRPARSTPAGTAAGGSPSSTRAAGPAA